MKEDDNSDHDNGRGYQDLRQQLATTKWLMTDYVHELELFVKVMFS